MKKGLVVLILVLVFLVPARVMAEGANELENLPMVRQVGVIYDNRLIVPYYNESSSGPRVWVFMRTLPGVLASDIKFVMARLVPDCFDCNQSLGVTEHQLPLHPCPAPWPTFGDAQRFWLLGLEPVWWQRGTWTFWAKGAEGTRYEGSRFRWKLPTIDFFTQPTPPANVGTWVQPGEQGDELVISWNGIGPPGGPESLNKVEYRLEFNDSSCAPQEMCSTWPGSTRPGGACAGVRWHYLEDWNVIQWYLPLRYQGMNFIASNIIRHGGHVQIFDNDGNPIASTDLCRGALAPN
jgi:hypothetical protein